MEFLKALGLEGSLSGTSLGDGGFLSGKDHEKIDSINPSNEEVIASVFTSQGDDYEKVIQASQTTFESWRQVPAPVRGELVRQIGLMLREQKDALGSLVALEMGKSKQEGDGEVQEMIDIADFAVGQSRMLYGKTMHSERPSHRLYEQWHPRGIVGVITAFNFPVAPWAWNAFIAVICGNTVVWKPSEKTPLCSLAVQNICNQAMQTLGYQGIFSLFIPKTHELAEQFVEDKRVPLISFTGSCEVGRKVGEKVARRLGQSILELGGNNAIIVDKTADLKLAIPGIVFGAVGTAGQRCTTTRRLLIHDSIFDEVCSQLVNAYEQVTIGDPLEPTNLMGPLIDRDAKDRYLSAIETVRHQGGELLIGGGSLDRPGFFVHPALVVSQNEWPIVQQETFGPLLHLIRVKDVREGIAQMNDVPQGLSSAIFTRDLQTAELFLSSQGSDCGLANVNIGTSGAEVGGAFGGEKDTGGGRESGSDSWKAYMRRQTNTINWGNELPLAQGIKFNIK